MKIRFKRLYTFSKTHALVAYQCWIASLLEDQSSLEAKEEMWKALSTIQGDLLQMLSNRDYLFELVDVLRGSSLNDE